MKFSDPVLPRPVMAVINTAAFIFYGLFGLGLVFLFCITIGYILTQSYYLLRNENKGKETTKDYIELFIIYLAMLKILTKLSAFFERQINKLLRRPARLEEGSSPTTKGGPESSLEDPEMKLFTKPQVSVFIIGTLSVVGALHYFVL